MCRGRTTERGRVASMACESPTRAAGLHLGRTVRQRGLDPARKDACNRTSPRAPPGAGQNRTCEDGRRHALLIGSIPARGWGLGRCQRPRKLRTARRPVTFVLVPGCGGPTTEACRTFGRTIGAMRRCLKAPLSHYLDLFAVAAKRRVASAGWTPPFWLARQWRRWQWMRKSVPPGGFPI
jgi:hypothetical protein